MNCATKNTTKIARLERRNAALWGVIAAMSMFMIFGCSGSSESYQKEIGDQFKIINDFDEDCLVKVLDRSHWVDEDPEYGDSFCYKVEKIDPECAKNTFEDTLYITHDRSTGDDVLVSNEPVWGCP